MLLPKLELRNASKNIAVVTRIDLIYPQAPCHQSLILCLNNRVHSGADTWWQKLPSLPAVKYCVNALRLLYFMTAKCPTDAICRFSLVQLLCGVVHANTRDMPASKINAGHGRKDTARNVQLWLLVIPTHRHRLCDLLQNCSGVSTGERAR